MRALFGPAAIRRRPVDCSLPRGRQISQTDAAEVARDQRGGRHGP
jgi:hypothetical protein